MTKKSLSHSVSQEPNQFLVYICKMMISPAIFFIFSKFWFFRFLGSRVVGKGSVKGGKTTYNYRFQSVTLHISGIVDHIIKIFGTQVNSCSSSSSINAIKKLRGVPHLLHICVIFFNIACFRVGKAILYLKTVIPVNTLKIKISDKYIFFVLNFPLLTFDFQTYKSMTNKKTN